MQDFNQPLPDFLQDSNYQQSVHKAQKRFLFRPFAIRFRLVKQLCHFRFFCHSLSIGTAIFFLGTIIHSAISSLWLAFLIALFFLALWEVVKGNLLQQLYEHFYQFKRLSYGLLAIILILLAGSVFSSIKGAEKFYKKENTLLSQVEEVYLKERSDISIYYDNQISQLQIKLDEYMESVSWKGKIDVRSKTNQKVIDMYTQQKKVLMEEKMQALNELKLEYDRTKSITISTQQFNKNIFGLLSLINELMIMILSWFLVFYDYKTVQEAKDFQPEPDNSSSFTDEDVQNDGFEPVQTPFEPEDSFNAGLTKSQAYLLKYQAVVDGINSGLPEKEIIDATGVSRTTFYNVKRCLKNG